jgi:uncharacterized protein (TIGR04255 family)
MSFRPAGSDHAVVSNVFTLTLDTPLAEGAIQQLKTRPAPWSEMLPAARDAAGLEVAVQDGMPQLRRRAAIEHSFLKPDGTATWLLRVGGQEITVECNLYTRWDRVWDQAKGLLQQAMTFSGTHSPSSVASFAMTVLDRFQTDDLNDNTKELFKVSNLIGSRLFDTNNLWHQHAGWLEADAAGELLTNVNIDVLPVDVGDRAKGKIVNFLHLQRLTPPAPILLTTNADDNGQLLEGIAARMHQRNKDILEVMLSDQAQKAIKLSGGKQ